MTTNTLTPVVPGVFTDVAPEALVGLVTPPEGFRTWDEYEDSFYPYWNEIEGKWEK